MLTRQQRRNNWAALSALKAQQQPKNLPGLVACSAPYLEGPDTEDACDATSVGEDSDEAAPRCCRAPAWGVLITEPGPAGGEAPSSPSSCWGVLPAEWEEEEVLGVAWVSSSCAASSWAWPSSAWEGQRGWAEHRFRAKTCQEKDEGCALAHESMDQDCSVRYSVISSHQPAKCLHTANALRLPTTARTRRPHLDAVPARLRLRAHLVHLQVTLGATTRAAPPAAAVESTRTSGPGCVRRRPRDRRGTLSLGPGRPDYTRRRSPPLL